MELMNTTNRTLRTTVTVYTCAVEYLDRQVSAFIDEIQAETEHETTFIVTADHGENLGFKGDKWTIRPHK